MKKEIEDALTSIRKEILKQGEHVELKSASELGAIELQFTWENSSSLFQRVRTELELEEKLKKMVPGVKFVRLTVS
jgi:hypothetical protein